MIDKTRLTLPALFYNSVEKFANNTSVKFAGEEDFTVRIESLNAAGLVSGIARRLRGDGTGIDDDFISNVRFCDNLMTSGNELASHRFNFAVVQAAANAA